MKVAIIMPLAEQKGGGEKRLWDLMLEGRDKGIDWLLIFLEDGPMVEQIRALGIEIYVVLAGRLSQLHRFTYSTVRIAGIVRNAKVDIILSWMWSAHLYGCPASLLSGVPCLWSQLENPEGYWLKEFTARLPCSGMFINSLSGKEILEELFPKRPIKLVYPGVALQRFSRDKLPSKEITRQALGLPLGTPIIGIVGRLQRWKGIHVLIDSMPHILKDYPDSYFIVVGGKHETEPDYEDFLRGKIKLLNLEKHITLTGSQKNIPEWMHAMDIFIHASDHEPFGIVIVEAMAMGKPVVASASGGPTEIIANGVNGLLVPYGNSSALANAVLRLLNDPDYAQQISTAAIERAFDFSTKHYVENFVDSIFDLSPKT
jgi:glycosyltransferase involved in cell wall biosynthesis